MLPLSHYFVKSTDQSNFVAEPTNVHPSSARHTPAKQVDARAASPSPLHTLCPQPPAQILTNDLKATIVNYALANGQAAALKRYPTTSRSSLSRWMAAVRAARASAVEEAPDGAAAIAVDVADIVADGRSGNGFRMPAPAYDRLYDWFHQLRGEGIAVTRRLLQSQVKHVLGESYGHLLKENGGRYTCSERMIRTLEAELNVSRRKHTTAKRGSIESKERMRDLFLSRVSYVCNEHKIPRGLVFHMDETAVDLLPTQRHSLHTRGAKTVPIQHTDDKRQCTCIVAGDLEGAILPAQVIFEAAAARNLPKVPGVFCTTSPKHWSTFETTCE